MTTATIGNFFERRPFVGFTMYLADGRSVRVSHPEHGAIGAFAMSVTVIHDDGQLETFDTALIVSCRTNQPVSDNF